MTVPTYIVMCQPWLQAKQLHSQMPQRYSSRAWLAAYNDSDLQAVLEEHPEAINRVQVAAYAHHALQQGASRSAIMRLFWSILLWGWAKDARGVKRSQATLQAPELGRLLQQVFGHVQNNEIGQAYQVFHNGRKTAINGYGESFFSKFLYFVGLGCGLKRYPLARDAKVQHALKVLLQAEAPPRNNVEGYLKYNEILYGWAAALNCRADSLEYLLYLSNAEFWQG